MPMYGTSKIVLLIKPEGAYGRRLLLGIAKYAQIHHHWSIFHEVEQHKRAFHFFKNLGADGIIADIREVEKIESLLRPQIPLITIGNTRAKNSNTPNIRGDTELTGKMGADHFLEHGFKYFAFCSYEEFEWSRSRCNEFVKRIKNAGFEAHIYKRPYLKPNIPWEKEQKMIMEWIKSLPKPLGIMACNDDFGRQILEACKFAKITVPEEVAVLGVDDDEIICNLTDPPLSSIFINTEKAGYQAAELLEDLMNGTEMTGQSIVAKPTHIQTRRSSDIFAIENPDIVNALRFIHQHAHKPIQVDDVVNATCLSRRTLYDKFQKALGRSVAYEIRKKRIDQIVKMLTETNLPINVIALKLGYPGTEKLSRFFNHEKGMTPSTYRKKHHL